MSLHCVTLLMVIFLVDLSKLFKLVCIKRRVVVTLISLLFSSDRTCRCNHMDTFVRQECTNSNDVITKVKTKEYAEVSLQKGSKELCYVSFTYNPGWLVGFERTLPFGQNFRRTKFFGGQNFRHLIEISAVLSAENVLSVLCFSVS